MGRTYQTHADGQAGISDSHEKLKRLTVPNDLRGKRVLDIGCNEGFFCNAMAQRGAARVLGIDFHTPSIGMAELLYLHPAIEYRVQSWDHLPDEMFDLVLWSSAMHYELDPARVFKDISRILDTNGVFILECGVAPALGSEMVTVQRQSDTRLYPTMELLTKLLSNEFVFRQVASPRIEPGDPIPRSVFHCRHRAPVVILFRGPTGFGKSSAARVFSNNATKVIALDLFVTRIKMGQFHHGALQNYILENFDGNDLTSLYEGIDAAGLTREYIILLAQGIASMDTAVIVEGYMTDRQAETLQELIGNRTLLWDARRMPWSPSN